MTATYSPKVPIWCAGCGHFGVQGAMSAALRQLEVPTAETIILAGIGCSGTIQNNLGTYGFTRSTAGCCQRPRGRPWPTRRSQ